MSLVDLDKKSHYVVNSTNTVHAEHTWRANDRKKQEKWNIPSHETIKQVSNAFDFRTIKEFQRKYNLKETSELLYQRLILTDSGRLFSVHSSDRDDVDAMEWPIREMGMAPVECISEHFKKTHAEFFIGCQDGSIYSFDEGKKRFNLISDHLLADESKITAVHQLCF